MNNEKLHFLSPLFLKYQSEFEKNPRSRVFAPLAESYRKVGMTDKAMEILSQGIRSNPSYVMGYMGLAFCYFDIKQFNLAYSTLRPLVDSNRDNIRLQRLFADICIAQNYKEEALETLKYLLFVNPRDKEVAQLVTALETEIDEKYKPNHKPIIIPEENFSNNDSTENIQLFDVDKLNSAPKIDFDDWLQIDLNKNEFEKKDDFESLSGWNIQKLNSDKSIIHNINLDLINHDDNDLDSYEEPENIKSELDAPIVTHTLVDLYCGQGHIEKAIEILEKILILNPNDLKTQHKLIEIKSLIAPLDQDVEAKSLSIVDTIAIDDDEDLVKMDDEDEIVEHHAQPNNLVDLEDLENTTEEDGRRNLMNILDEKVIFLEENEVDVERNNRIEKKLSLFLKKIKERALDYQNRF